MIVPVALDHVVINTLHGMDAAAECFSALGFALTPRGYHSLGSINHLMMTPGPYLELVGVPTSGAQRSDVLDSPFGLNGLVLRSDDADATFARLGAAGFPVSPPVAFSRPVDIDGVTQEACFKTVRVAATTFPAGRVYYCEHLTPDYVWRPEWLTHPNGFSGIDRLTVESLAPEADAALYASACGTHVDQAGDRWLVHLGSFTVEVLRGPASRFARLGLRFATLADIESRAHACPDVSWQALDGGGATLSIPALALVLDCRRAE